MVTVPSTLILGAGASAPYGFPTGRQLKTSIIDDLGSHVSRLSDLRQVLLQCGHPAHELDRFRKSLQFSNQLSVDAFLENRKDFKSVGKNAIAAALIPKEDPNALLPTNEIRWYEYLFDTIKAPPDKFANNRLSVITFNYDRSLEFFLFRAFKHSYGLSDEEVSVCLEHIPIVHVYGQLENLIRPGVAGRSYSPDCSSQVVERCGNSIQILPEGEATSEAFADARRLLSDITHGCFLGFGFNRTNVDRLFANLGGWGARELYASSDGIADGEKASIVRYIRELTDLDVQCSGRKSLETLRSTEFLAGIGA